jgi:uncharacterized protein (TIGR03067 family)
MTPEVFMTARSGSFPVLLVGYALSLSTLLAGEAGPQKAVEDEAKLIQGTWNVVELHQVSHQSSKEEKEFLKSGGYKITITADKMIHSLAYATRTPDKGEVKYRLDVTKSPKVLEMLVDGKVIAKAIYDIKGDDLRICQGRKPPFGGEPEPPTDFDIAKAKRGSFPTLYVLKRDANKQVEK